MGNEEFFSQIILPSYHGIVQSPLLAGVVKMTPEETKLVMVSQGILNEFNAIVGCNSADDWYQYDIETMPRLYGPESADKVFALSYRCFSEKQHVDCIVSINKEPYLLNLRRY